MNGERRTGKRAEQKRRWDDENPGMCPSCGGPMARHSSLCAQCRKYQSQLINEDIVHARMHGFLNVEIARDLKISPQAVVNRIGRMRDRGMDIPSSPYFVQRTTR